MSHDPTNHGPIDPGPADHEPGQPDPGRDEAGRTAGVNVEEIENDLRVVERAIAVPAARGGHLAHGVVLQASWLLSALGRWESAAAAAALAQACWGGMRDEHPSPYGGGLFWGANQAAAVAYMGVGGWSTAEKYVLDVLRDFAEEDKSFYLFELCLHAQGRLPWNRTQSFVMLTDPARELAAFDARSYALEQYREDLITLDPAGPEPGASDHEAGGQAGKGTRWRGVPIPPDLVGDDWTTEKALAEPDPTIRACAIATIGPERYAREAEAITGQPVDTTDDSDEARSYAWRRAIPRALGRPGRMN